MRSTKKKEDYIRKYILTATDRTEAFNEILQSFVEIAEKKSKETYEMAAGVNIAIHSLANNKDEYIKCVNKLMSVKIISGINTRQIVQVLFSLLDSQEVLKLLGKDETLNRNEWTYAFYSEIPQNCIGQAEVDGLYEFLMDESDQNIETRRDINFLDKYLEIDPDVIYKASRIILKKQDYSPSAVRMYFEQQFNEHHINPKKVIRKFSRDIRLLEQIYLCVIEKCILADYKGALFHAIFKVDKTFVREYVKKLVVMRNEDSSQDNIFEKSVFYQEDEYLDILDLIVDESIVCSPYPPVTVPRIIKQLLEVSKNGEFSHKCDLWIRHFIGKYCDDKNKMRFIFEAIDETSITLSTKYIAHLIDCTDDFGIFEAIPLIPLSYSWSDSLVPTYSAWIDHLQNLLPLFPGIKFIKHKNRVQVTIEDYRKRIKDEEISDIIRG